MGANREDGNGKTYVYLS